ncbi:AAA family ATPase [Fusobacterium nucleatum subsp. nucleatum]|uniref:AAA family ATPase n=1 Tax=Fusobacterium nucleatum subsp. nucleatum TaxID=76856 RepID=A0A101K5A6_FUSNC|nr:RNA-binding domain-containing protein [Fusobacterium nucleatum]ALF23554.1 AAA family ATPase [Fusobacterium nucleatum subsp. nucleatum ChDC F316]ASG27073.1 AAA family ATPase [Fusobacterium nucleatum subsp. nucleatum]KUL97795.1 AAA family ATPase [Fusobacterium nucleatum subsp. nucleatum]
MELKENINVEFKKKFTTELKKEIVAFANTNEGTIYIGIDDFGNIIGIKNVDEVLNQVVLSIRNSIKPDITMYCNSKIERIENKDVIIIQVQRGALRPYYIADKGLKPSGVYVRQGSSSVPASEESIRKMIKETDGDSYEKLRSLNQDLTFDYTKKIFEKNALLFGLSQKKTLGLIGEDDLYTNLALLLSDQCNHTLKVAVFEGIEKNIFKDRKEFKGSLLKQVTEAYEFINLLNKTEATFEGLTRKDERDYPTEAIREALLNAVVHREYSFSGSTLVNIYEDRIEFISLGGIVSGLSLDSIMLGVSQSRNEKLANIFYRLHLIEAYGTGIKKIFSSYEKIGLKPTIKTEIGAFQVVLPNIHYVKKIENDNTEIKSIYKDILDFIEKKGGTTRKEIEEYINLSQTRVITLLKEMLELNLIKKEKDKIDRRAYKYYRK